MKPTLITLLVLITLLFVGGLIVDNQLAAATTQMPDTQTKGMKFSNEKTIAPMSFSKNLEVIFRFLTEKKVDAIPSQNLPIERLTNTQLDELSNDEIHVIKLVHSSVLLKIYGEIWLLDPVFSDRASPVSFFGPKRFHDLPIELKDIKHIDKVLISHNHYDHLDKNTIKHVAQITEQFLVPLGVKSDLMRWGVHENKVIEFDWWQELEVNQGLIAFTPTQHFSGRAISDGNKTLWGSWVIKTANNSIYFSGDSGYFKGFAEIGEKYGPFDLTMIETGAYDKNWSEIHMTPEQSVQAHLDLKGKIMMPIHNSSFDLAFHAWYEPLERVSTAATTKGISLTTPIIGQVLTLSKMPETTNWWHAFK